MATDPNVLWTVLSKLAVPAGNSLAMALQQQGNPAVFQQQQENQRLQQAQAFQQYWNEQNAARQDAASDAAAKQYADQQKQQQFENSRQTNSDVLNANSRGFTPLSPGQPLPPGGVTIGGVGWAPPAAPQPHTIHASSTLGKYIGMEPGDPDYQVDDDTWNKHFVPMLPQMAASNDAKTKLAEHGKFVDSQVPILASGIKAEAKPGDALVAQDFINQLNAAASDAKNGDNVKPLLDVMTKWHEYKQKQDEFNQRASERLGAANQRMQMHQDTRADRIIQNNMREIETTMKPVDDIGNRIATARASLAQRDATSYRLLIPQVLTALAGGQGFRLTDTEFRNFLGGKSGAESVQSIIRKRLVNRSC